MGTKRSAHLLAWIAVVVVALAAVRSLYGQAGKTKAQQDGNDTADLCRRHEADIASLREDVSRLSRNLEWLSGNLYRPGMILPFHGPKADAMALEKEGWFICDARTVTDPRAAPRFRGKATPDLRNRLLKGADESGSPTGQDVVTSSTDGRHAHLLPAKWYPRGDNAEGGRFSRVDTNGPVQNGNPPVQESGDHNHTVKMDPPSYTVIYLIYVRDVTARE